jgi:hypothetical protein
LNWEQGRRERSEPLKIVRTSARGRKKHGKIQESEMRVFKECIEIQEEKTRKKDIRRKRNTIETALNVEVHSRIIVNNRSFALRSVQENLNERERPINVSIRNATTKPTGNGITLRRERENTAQWIVQRVTLHSGRK